MNKKQDLLEIVKLHRHFPQYNNLTNEQLMRELAPLVNLEQYVLIYWNDELAGYNSWAYLNEESEEYLKEHLNLKADMWNNGDNIWIMDFMAIKHFDKVWSASRSFWKEKFGLNTVLNYITIKDNSHLTTVTNVVIREHW
jgi:hemolysin-activating ACP:hemolysin acyltransferase